MIKYINDPDLVMYLHELECMYKMKLRDINRDFGKVIPNEVFKELKEDKKALINTINEIKEEYGYLQN